MTKPLFLVLALAGIASPVAAADLLLVEPTLIPEAPPAVSGVNGKIEFDGGYLSIPDEAGSARIGGSLSLPIGESFGAQFDATARYTGDSLAYGGGLHLFTRDPDSYLAGLAGVVIRSEDATLAAIGPEAELYLDRVSLEAWGGYAVADYEDDTVASLEGAFAFADIAFYPTDNLRLEAGLSHVLDVTAVHVGGEYLLDTLPVSLAADVSYDENADWAATLGIKGYFGGSGSLIDRHRKDDPRNRAADLMAAGETYLVAPAKDEEIIGGDEYCRELTGSEYAYWDPINQWCNVP